MSKRNRRPNRQTLTTPQASAATIPPTETWYRISAAAGSAGAVEIYLYDVIGGWGISAQSFLADCREAGVFSARRVDLHIHSPGGDVMDGFAIYNSLSRLKCDGHIHIDGMAASMASVIACLPGWTVHMPENAWLMIHKPWGGAIGNADDLRDYADWLDRNEAMLLTAYTTKTGKGRDEIAAMLTEETWLDGPQAFELGFADELVAPLQAAAQINPNKTREFENMPKALKILLAPQSNAGQPTQQPVAQPAPIAAPVAQHPTTPPQGATEAEIRAQVMAAEQTRRHAIQDLHALTGNRFSDLLQDQLADMSISADAAKTALMAELGKNTQPTAAPTAHIHAGNGNIVGDSVRASLMARTGHAAAESGNRYDGYSLRELARASLEGRGISTGGRSPMEYVGLAFTHHTSDFGHILMDVANKSVLQGWTEANETFERWTRKGVLTDFKIAHRVGLGDFGSLRQVREGAEYKHITLGDHGATIQLATYGELFSITRQAIINDDLDMLTRIPALMGAAARGTIGDLVYAVLTDNAKLADGQPLFGAGRGNLLTGADSALGITALSAAKQLMRSHKTKVSGGKPRALNIRPAFALVPTELEDTAFQLINSTSVPGADINAGIVNPLKGFVEVIGEPRLSDSSALEWYLAAQGDTIEVAYLDGLDTPYIEQQQGFTVDGVVTKVRIDAGVSALDHRGLVKAAGK